MYGKDGGRASSTADRTGERAVSPPTVGKRTLVEALAAREAHGAAPVQRKTSGEPLRDGTVAASIARHGAEGGSQQRLHRDRLQACFGRRDISGVNAHEDHAITPPRPGIDKVGFIDHTDGANIRTGPLESGGVALRDRPLPPATRVFVSGTHPDTSGWWYVTAMLSDAVVRGYVQDLRVNVHVPEPLAELHWIHSGETAEQLAKQKFGDAVTDGHDLRYYENVLLYVNQEQQRPGITGTYQDPGVLGGGSNHVQLKAGHLIWLVSAPYAKALQGVVPSGSLTGGAVAKVKRVVGHIEDLLHSVTEARHHFGEVAGEYAQAIRDHLPEIAGVVAAFIMAEATSAFLAATPTGVGQIAAVVIQLALTAFGVAGMVQAGVEAVKHASQWLTLAWTAKGKDEAIAAASREFLKMLVSVAIAALSYAGVKGNYGNALRIASSMPTSGLPALAVAGGGQLGGAGAGTGAGTGVLIGPTTGSIGTAGNAMMQADKEHGGKSDDAEKDAADKAAKEKAAAEQAAREAALKQAGLTFSRPQLQHAFKHAADFGVTGNMNNVTLEAFKSAIEKHVASPATRAIAGEYRGLQRVTHFADPATGLNVIRDASGGFLSGWKLSAQQLQHVLATGNLGGG